MDLMLSLESYQRNKLAYQEKQNEIHQDLFSHFLNLTEKLENEKIEFKPIQNYPQQSYCLYEYDNEKKLFQNVLKFQDLNVETQISILKMLKNKEYLFVKTKKISVSKNINNYQDIVKYKKRLLLKQLKKALNILEKYALIFLMITIVLQLSIC